MPENEGQAKAPAAGEEEAQVELGPIEKLEEQPPSGSIVPGAQKPSSEVHNEVNLNTE